MVLQRSKAKTKFQYRGRGAEQVQRRASQQGGSRDSYFTQDVKFFSAAAGSNRLRILPPTWGDDQNPPQHYGYDIYLHYGIGPDDASYLCHDKMKGVIGVCPICIERATAEAQGEKDYADTLKPGKRVAVYLINRDKSQEGPLVWSMPWTLDREVSAGSIDKSTGEVFLVDDPEAGYDVHFDRNGTGTTTKYTGVQVARRPSPLHDDPNIANQWLDHIAEHPLPNVLVFHDPEHIKKVFGGGAVKKDEETTPPAKAAAPAEEQPRRSLRQSATAVPAAPTWDSIHAMDEETLVQFVEAHPEVAEGLPEDANDLPLAELADVVCELAGIAKPAPAAAAAAPKAGGSYRDRLAKLRQT
jgi:hypothetical protein